MKRSVWSCAEVVPVVDVAVEETAEEVAVEVREATMMSFL
jgi:hypothetical protein